MDAAVPQAGVAVLERQVALHKRNKIDEKMRWLCALEASPPCCHPLVPGEMGPIIMYAVRSYRIEQAIGIFQLQSTR